MNDIFISYAHLDDKPLTEGQKGWITKFHRILQVRLGQLLGVEPTIWRDPKLCTCCVDYGTNLGVGADTRAIVNIIPLTGFAAKPTIFTNSVGDITSIAILL